MYVPPCILPFNCIGKILAQKLTLKIIQRLTYIGTVREVMGFKIPHLGPKHNHRHITTSARMLKKKTQVPPHSASTLYVGCMNSSNHIVSTLLLSRSAVSRSGFRGILEGTLLGIDRVRLIKGRYNILGLVKWCGICITHPERTLLA